MRKFRGIALILLGVMLFAGGIGLTGFNLWDDYRAAEASDNLLAKLREQLDLSPLPNYSFDDMTEAPAIEIDGDRYIGILSVPDKEIFLPVMDSWSYAKLKIAPCRYSGSLYEGNLVIAAHNYDAHFGRLNSLKTGNLVTFTDVSNRQFRYTVAEVEVLPPTAVEKMTSGDWDLTLFTCTFGGQTRRAIRCRLIG